MKQWTTSALGENKLISAQYERLVQDMPVAAYVVDAEGYLCLYNQAAANLWGRQPQLGIDRWCGSQSLMQVDGTPLTAEQCPLAEVIEQKQAIVCSELIVLRPDGTQRYVMPYPQPIFNNEGQIVGAINILVDVTSSRESERAHARLAAIVESSDDAIVSKTLEGRIITWNAAAQRIFGYTAEEVIGQPITMLIPEHLQSEETEILQRLRNGEHIDHFETVRRAKDGHMLDVSLSISPVRDDSGRIIGASRIARDITARKRNERELAQLRQQLAYDLEGMTRLHALGMDLMRQHDLASLLTQTVQAAIAITKADMGNIQLYDEASHCLRIVAHQGFKQPFLDYFDTVCQDETSACAEALKRRQRIIIKDVATSEILTDSQTRQVLLDAGVNAVQSTPLVCHRGRLLGMFSTHFLQPRTPHARELRLLDLLARQAAEQIERIEAQEQLRQSEVRFRAMANATPATLWIADFNGQITWMSDRWYEYTGLARPWSSDHWKQAVHPDDRQRCIEQWRAAIMQGVEYEVEARYRRHDGVYHYFLSRATPIRVHDGEITGWFGSSTDIDQQKKMEQAVRDSEQRFRTLADNALVGIFMADVKGKCLYVNQHWTRITGLNLEQMQKREWIEALHEEDRQRVAEQWGDVIKRQDPSITGEFRFMHPSGRVLWVQGGATALHDEQGNINGYIGSIIDITPAKQAQELLEQDKHELEQRVADRTERLRALTMQLSSAEQRERRRLAQTLHNDVQQLLAAAMMQANLAEADGQSNEAMTQVKKLTAEAIAACRALTVGLSPPVLPDVDLLGALEWLSRYMQAHHDLEVQLVCEQSLPLMDEDKRAILFDITRELLFNVVKHARVDRAVVRLNHRDGQFSIEVADQGSGCSPEQLENPGKNSCGLFSIRERLADIGGRLETRSAEGQGCQMRMILPGQSDMHRQPSCTQQPLKPVAEEVHAPGRDQLRIILADDHQILRQGLAKLLSAQRDMSVVAQANDGREALELSRIHRPDVVVMDVTMPRLGGVEATRLIRSEMPEVRVIGLSMHEHNDMAARMMEAGAENFLTKDGPVEKLLISLRGSSPAA
ncbi:MAG: PAS domain S-box protein [Phycisphaeraceae bacterium]|nr:PAS domain S-box protein [Phycisphaeraceae bacterium]